MNYLDFVDIKYGESGMGRYVISVTPKKGVVIPKELQSAVAKAQGLAASFGPSVSIDQVLGTMASANVDYARNTGTAGATLPVVRQPAATPTPNPYVAAITNQPPASSVTAQNVTAPPFSVAPPPAPVRPDLQNNWNLAQAAQWGQPVHGQIPLANYIKSFATLADYAAADAAGNQDYAARSQATAVIPGAGAAPGGTSGGGSSGGAPAVAIRPDLQNNWNLAQAAQWGQPVHGNVGLGNYIKSFATIQDYAAADAAGNKDYGTRSQATAVIPGGGGPAGPGGGTGAGGGSTPGPSATDAANQAALNAALAAWRAKPGNEGAGIEHLLGYWSENGGTQDVGAAGNELDFALLTALADSGNQDALRVLDVAGYENSASTEEMPIEQGLLNMALPGLLGDVEGDAGRRTLAATLSGQATSDYEAARKLLSPEENARRLAEELGQADRTSGAISASSATAAAEQLAALQASVAAMQGNLTGELAAKAAALQQQVAAFTANLNTFDATQKAALAEQIAATQKNLEDSVGAQRQALTTEIAALRGAADAQSVARRAALQAEIDGLTAAQAPMAQARLDSANALSTAINLGLEATNDAMTAQRAKQGYIGSSSFSDAAQTRATIGARQQAAQVMGGAREANAADLRTINSRGATEGRSLADEYANNLLTISGREATGGRSLADVLAQGTQAIGDTGAAGTATIKSNTGTGLMNIGNAGAGQSYQDQVVGSSQLKSLLDSLAQGSAGISATRTTQQQAARDLGTTAKQGYFDNAYTRGLAGTLARPGLATNLVGTLDAFGNYGNSGLGRTQDALNWWSTNTGAPPTPGTTPAVVNNSGNDIAGLGAGLLGSAFNVGNANSWWQKPTNNWDAYGTGKVGGG